MIKATLILSLACCAIPWLRRRSAAERHLLWVAALAVAAALPLLNLLLPSWQPVWARQVVDVLPAVLSVAPFGNSAEHAGIVVRASAIESGWPVGRLLSVLWMLGTGVVLLRLSVEGVKLARLARSARPLTDRRWTAALCDVSHALGIKRPIQLLQDVRGTLPMTWGVWHPRVLLPACAAEWSEERTRAVLAHELAHVARGDWMVQILSELSCAMYWFNPLFWMARNRIGGESERACDDAVLSLGIEGSDYAGHLLDIARATQADGRLWSPTLAMARPSQLERRFAALLDAGANRQPITSPGVIAVLAGAALLSTPIAAMSLPDPGTTVEVRTANLPAVRESIPTSSRDSAATPIRQVRLAASVGIATGLVAPEILEYSTPALYSDEARTRRIEGLVTVAARVEVDGHVRVARIVRGLGFGLDQNALVALRQWRFLPGMRNGEPVETTAEVDIEFSLRNEALNELIANDMATRVGPGITPPHAVRTVDVPLAPRSSNRPRRGTVVLDVVLQENGTPKIVRILRSMDAEHDNRAVEAFEQWRFSPAQKDGHPVKVRMNAEVTFGG